MRQRRKSEVRRRQILDAAIRVFAEKGFHSSRVSDIAKRADVAYGLVYHYFLNKEEILRTIFVERWAVVLQIIENTFNEEQRTVADRLKGILAFLLDVYRDNAAIVDIIVLELMHSPEFMRDEVVRGFQRAFSSVIELIRQGKKTGEIRKDADPQILAVFYFGAIEVTFNAMALKVLDLSALPSQTVAENIVTQLMRGAAAPPP